MQRGGDKFPKTAEVAIRQKTGVYIFHARAKTSHSIDNKNTHLNSFSLLKRLCFTWFKTRASIMVTPKNLQTTFVIPVCDP